MRMLRASIPFLMAALAVSAAALSSAGCGDSGESTGGSSSSSSSGGLQPECTMPTEVPCSDEVILQMNLKKDPVAAMITNDPDGTGFHSNVDATAGGAFTSNPTSYTYAKFTADGLQKVDIGDEDSLTSMDWDIAFRRYVIRINSGHSGPSCVSAARVPDQDGAYEDITTEPDGLTYHTDEYFTDSCMLIPDGSGLPNSPATALSSYWTYPGCVAMTHYPYVLKLADGRRIKLTIDDYYSPDVQMQCDTAGTIPMSNTGSGNIQLRWAEIP